MPKLDFANNLNDDLIIQPVDNHMQLVTDSIQQNLQKMKETVLSIPDDKADTGRDSFHSFESSEAKKLSNEKIRMETMPCYKCNGLMKNKKGKDCKTC